MKGGRSKICYLINERRPEEDEEEQLGRSSALSLEALGLDPDLNSKSNGLRKTTTAIASRSLHRASAKSSLFISFTQSGDNERSRSRERSQPAASLVFHFHSGLQRRPLAEFINKSNRLRTWQFMVTTQECFSPIIVNHCLTAPLFNLAKSRNCYGFAFLNYPQICANISLGLADYENRMRTATESEEGSLKFNFRCFGVLENCIT